MRRCFPAIALAIVFIGPAAALDLPARKPGLWEIKLAPEGVQMQVMHQHCIDAATDKLMNERFSGGHEVCSKQEISRSGSTIVVDSSCKFGNTASTTHAVFEGDFDSAYTVKISTTLEDGVKRNMTLLAKWMGACKPGQKPGDIEMPSGVKMNVLDMPKGPPRP